MYAAATPLLLLALLLLGPPSGIVIQRLLLLPKFALLDHQLTAIKEQMGTSVRWLR